MLEHMQSFVEKIVQLWLTSLIKMAMERRHCGYV
jgi:hypothetical protein